MISLPLLAGGFRVAQFVRIEREPSHWPFMAVMALSASCGAIMKTERWSEAETESGDTVEKYQLSAVIFESLNNFKMIQANQLKLQ